MSVLQPPGSKFLYFYLHATSAERLNTPVLSSRGAERRRDPF
jgi:hypothetical protein